MRLLLLPLVLTTALSCAQSWCTPGAEWEFNFGSQQASGITYAYHSGDTTIGAMTFQRIDHTIYAMHPEGNFGQPFITELQPLYIRYEDDVAWIWDQFLNALDTLMWFGAVPGDHWTVYGLGGSSWGRFYVLDTGRFDLGGDSLRWLAVNSTSGPLGPDTL